MLTGAYGGGGGGSSRQTDMMIMDVTLMHQCEGEGLSGSRGSGGCRGAGWK